MSKAFQHSYISSTMRHLRALFVLACFLVPAAPAGAHALGQSYLYLRIYDHQIEVRLEITTKDLNRALGLGLPESGVTPEAIAAHLDSIRTYAESRVYLGIDELPLPLQFQTYSLLRTPVGTFVQLTYLIDQLAQIPDLVDVAYSVLFEVDPDHRNMLVIEHNWKTATFNNESGVSLIFSPRSQRQTLDLSRASVLTGFLGFIGIGTWHIWIGLDHILFLLALILPAVLTRTDGRWVPVESFRPALLNIVGIVTCFTIAHSITLSLAALEVISLSAPLVESIIAASIAVAALHNLFPQVQVREWTIAFVFGLFHGLGFAFILTGLGLEPRYLALSLLGFNLGVEVGQVAIIALAFPILFALRKTRFYMPLLKIGSIMLIGIALLWFVERAFEVPLLSEIKRAVVLTYRGLLGGG